MYMVPRAGIEPAWCYHRGILNPLRLPVSPPGHVWRLRPESNRRTRLCRPLHDHSATQPMNKKKRLTVAFFWSGKRGSNSRPQPWQGCALPLSYSRNLRSDILLKFISLSTTIIIFFSLVVAKQSLHI